MFKIVKMFFNECHALFPTENNLKSTLLYFNSENVV